MAIRCRGGSAVTPISSASSPVLSASASRAFSAARRLAQPGSPFLACQFPIASASRENDPAHEIAG